MELALCVLIVVLVVLIWLATRRPRDAAAEAEQRTRSLVTRGRLLDATKIREAAEGSVVRIMGKTRLLDGWVVSPISKRACAYWRLRISIEHAGLKSGWRQIAERSSSCPFVLANGVDQCLIDPKVATIHVQEGTRVSQYPSRWLSSRHRAVLAAAGISLKQIEGTQVRFEESVIAFDTPAAIVGVGSRVQRAQTVSPYREGLETWLQFDGAELFISDDLRLLRPQHSLQIVEKPKGPPKPEVSIREELPFGWTMPYLEQVERWAERQVARKRRRRIAVGVASGIVAIAGAVFAVAFT